MRHNFFAFVAALAVASILGCTCGGDNNGNPDGGGDGGDGGPRCAAIGESCAEGALCCQGYCINGVCDNSLPPACTASGGQCVDNTDCCTNRCEGGVCSNEQCLSNGATCSQASSCCSGNCASGACAPIPGSSATCKLVGETCSVGTDCCSTNCQNNVCTRQAWCKASNELCYSDLDCCEQVCSKNDGTPGYCIAPPGGCTMGGMPCTGPSNCCTRICADPGTGATVCQPASGCIMTGLACIDNQACCGGGDNPNGSVVCEKLEPTDTYGRCDNGQSCNPVGNICGAAFPGVLPDGGAVDVNASQNCCEGKKAVCKLDSSGIPRCFGGGSGQCPTGYTGVAPCCIELGQLCQFKDQCCNGAPCVPDEQGTLRCSESTCTPLGASCSVGGTPCCSGACLGDEFGTVCRLAGSFDGGTDGGSCRANGNACNGPGDCCSLSCIGGTCQTPSACQGTGQACTNPGDCCTGLTCIFGSGSVSGTCQVAACAGGGQSCSSANQCCQGLSCMKTGGQQACTDGTACTCITIIN